ncbi:TonB-dependent siderophore receptor [Fortiea contorta]|uniref:TonB-dependent siderophore receptor n=1 Tax=Fortiea contorta TaxID=1892405 RepID=UPI00034BA719|nr:TonB-dependent siderophore receptor [Fortiea contorta]
MKLDKLFPSLLLAGAVVVAIATPARSEKAPDKSTFNKPLRGGAALLAQSPTPEVVQITGVKANPSNKGVEVILQTTQGEKLQITNRSTGNSFIADVAGGQLRLPSGEAFTFRSEKPIAGITEVTVTNIDANTVRVTVVGEQTLPTIELFDEDSGLVFAIASTATATQPPAESEAPASQPSDASDAPIELVVTGEQDKYGADNASSATRTDTPLRDIPQAIQVIPQQLLEDQKAQRLADALQNVAGVTPQNSSINSFDQFLIRGFSGESTRNGLRDTTNEVSSVLSNVERIEVLKGPASVLYGQGSPGGTINIITKQPLSTPFYSLSATIGSYNLYQGALDFSGPINDTKTVLYRLNASIQKSDSFVDFANIDNSFIAPALTWLIGKNTTLSLAAEYLNTEQKNYTGLPAKGTVLPNPNGQISLNRFTGEPSDFYKRSVFRIGYDFEHRFSENWKLQNAFRASFRTYDLLNTFSTGLSEDGRFLNRGGVRSQAENGGQFRDVYNLDNYIVGKFNTGSIKHQLVAGFNLSRDEFRNRLALFSLAPLDLFNPIYNNSRFNTRNLAENVTKSEVLGIYLQDQISLTDNFKVLLGGRFDIANQSFENLSNSSSNSFKQDEVFSPRIGIVYQPIKPISLYASYSKSFQQVIGSGLDNQLFKPEKGTQYEVGIKADFTEKISSTLAFYELTRSNVLTTDASGLFSIQTGEQRSRGIELNITGEVLPGWNVIASYAYTDAKITRDNDFPIGNKLNNVPANALSLWTTYEIQNSNLRGLGFGLGLFYVDERQGDLENSFKIPSYIRTDAAIYYRRDNFKVALNIKNLFDITYFETANSDTRVFYGQPLTVQGTISWQF